MKFNMISLTNTSVFPNVLTLFVQKLNILHKTHDQIGFQVSHPYVMWYYNNRKFQWSNIFYCYTTFISVKSEKIMLPIYSTILVITPFPESWNHLTITAEKSTHNEVKLYKRYIYISIYPVWWNIKIQYLIILFRTFIRV